MTQTRAPRRLSPDVRRAAILAEAQAVLAHESPGPLTIDAVAQRSGVSAALVHHYFGTREGLVEAAVTAAAEEVIALLRAAPDAGVSPAVRLIDSLDRYLAYVEAHPASWSLLLRTGVPAAAAVAERVDREALELSLRTLLPDAPAPDALVVALRGWLALVKDVCWRWLNDGTLDRDQVAVLVTTAYDGCLRAAAAVDPAAEPALAAFERG